MLVAVKYTEFTASSAFSSPARRTRLAGRRMHRASTQDNVDRAYRTAMSHLAATVVMVTCTVDDRPWGLTISACCSVSATPPTLLVSLGCQTASVSSIRAQGRFGVSILGQRGRAAALAGSKAGTPKFLDDFCVGADASGCPPVTPVVRGALAHLDCGDVRELEVADHVVFFGAVQDVILFNSERPLLYYARDYTMLDEGEPWWC